MSYNYLKKHLDPPIVLEPVFTSSIQGHSMISFEENTGENCFLHCKEISLQMCLIILDLQKMLEKNSNQETQAGCKI